MKLRKVFAARPRPRPADLSTRLIPVPEAGGSSLAVRSLRAAWAAARTTLWRTLAGGGRWRPGPGDCPLPPAFAHYRLEPGPDGAPLELGRGAMGVTYRATDIHLRRPVALKVIRPDLLSQPAVRERFFREARAAARLVHPHAAVVYHFGVEGGTHFYAMEFIAGGTLEALVRRDGPLRFPPALRYVRQVARALRAAHRRGIVHRDLKPANLLLHADPDGDGPLVKVIDFGLARLTGAEEELGGGGAGAAQSAQGFVGTPFFASPEQAEERAVDIRSDIYSLGATWWFLLTGHPPFRGTAAQVLAQHLHRQPPFEDLPGLPPTALALLRAMLAKHPEDRPADPAALCRALDACQLVRGPCSPG